MNKDIDFYYFSGTGNTFLVVREMAEVFRKSGCKVSLFPMEKTDPDNVNVNHTIGLGFPAACSCTFLFVLDFIRALPNTQGTEIFMVNTQALFSLGLTGPLKEILSQIGYKTIGAKKIKMPGNNLPRTINREKNRILVEKGLKEAGDFAKTLLEGTAKWPGQLCIGDLVYSICSSPAMWESLGREAEKMKVDREKCTLCGICRDLCPVENIKIESSVEIGTKCQQCMRCISFCPAEAIGIDGRTFERYRAVEAKELLNTG